MIIGYDAKRAAHNNTGLGNYSRYIIKSVSQLHPGHQLRLYTPKEAKISTYNDLLSAENVLSVLPDTRTAATLGSLWRSYNIIGQLQRDNVAVYHGLSNELPFGIDKSGIASVVTIHDLIFRIYPQFYKMTDRNIYDIKFRYACQKSDRIVAVSECTKRDIVKHYNISPDKIDVIYQNCADVYKNVITIEEKERVKKLYNLPSRFILNVGTIESRKNVLLAIRALPFVDTDTHLVIVGRKTAYINDLYDFIHHNQLNNRVHFIHNVAINDLPAIYHLAQLFVYPSLYEGFGIPIVEALTTSTPVIAATGSCLEEAGGDASIYIAPNDVRGMAEAIKTVLNTPTLRKEMIGKGLEHIARFDKQNTVEQLIKTYNTALECNK